MDPELPDHPVGEGHDEVHLGPVGIVLALASQPLATSDQAFHPDPFPAQLYSEREGMAGFVPALKIGQEAVRQGDPEDVFQSGRRGFSLEVFPDLPHVAGRQFVEEIRSQEEVPPSFLSSLLAAVKASRTE